MRTIKQESDMFPYMTSDEFAALCGIHATLGDKDGHIWYTGEYIAQVTGTWKLGNLSYTTYLTSEEVINTIIRIFNSAYRTDDTRIVRFQYAGARIINKYFQSSSSSWALPVPFSDFKNHKVSIPIGTTLDYDVCGGSKLTITNFALRKSGVTYDGSHQGGRSSYFFDIPQSKLLDFIPPKTKPLQLDFAIDDIIKAITSEGGLVDYVVYVIFSKDKSDTMCELRSTNHTIHISLTSLKSRLLRRNTRNTALEGMLETIVREKALLKDLRKYIIDDIERVRLLGKLNVAKPLVDPIKGLVGSIKRNIRKLIKSRRLAQANLRVLNENYHTIQNDAKVVYEKDIKYKFI